MEDVKDGEEEDDIDDDEDDNVDGIFLFSRFDSLCCVY